MKRIDVRAGKPYQVKIGRGLLRSCGAEMQGIDLYGKIMIVTDDNVAPLYLQTVSESLKNCGFSVYSHTLPHGENSKNFDELVKLLNFTAHYGLTRSDTLVALGGGVVGDLCGFAAAIYMRGVHFVQLPTTLLAAVDSSVGGKTAVDLAEGKNLAGAFYQPDLVLCDPDAFVTLPEKEYANGMAEVIKYGFIRDKELLELLQQSFEEEEVVARCVQSKADIVANDEFDRGERMLLNFGHTFGHAAELLSGYSISHGEGVAAGMATVTRAAVKFGICDGASLELLLSALEKYSLPRVIPFRVPEMRSAVLSDKKNVGGELKLIVPEKAGKCAIRGIDPASVGKWIVAGRTSGWNRQK